MYSGYECARKWVEKANIEQDSFDKFVYSFFALNALYSPYYNGDERAAIKQLFNNCYNGMHSYQFKTKINKIFDMDEYQFFVNRKPIKNCRFRNINDNEIFDTSRDTNELKYYNLYRSNRAMLMIIYQIRCNLFHGNKAFYNPDDQEIMNNAANLLTYYVNAMLNN